MKKLAVSSFLALTLLVGWSKGQVSQTINLQQAAQDRAAQSELMNALVTASVNLTNRDTYTGFDPRTATLIDPSLTYVGDEPASVDVVSINLADGGDVVLSTLSASGQAFCIANNISAGETRGTVDAQGAMGVSDCIGDW